MDELESIVDSLEGERLPLGQLVDRYERGMALLQQCQTQLDTARQRIDLITVRSEKARLEAFQPGEAPEESAAATRPARAARTTPSRTDDDEIRLF